MATFSVSARKNVSVNLPMAMAMPHDLGGTCTPNGRVLETAFFVFSDRFGRPRLRWFVFAGWVGGDSIQ
jgi:hypothetical protein